MGHRLDRATLSVTKTKVRYGKHIDESIPKSLRSQRTIAIGPSVVEALRDWKVLQQMELHYINPELVGHVQLVVTNVDGTAPNPEAFSKHFQRLAEVNGLPVIRLHDLRHSYATTALAAGVPVKVLSQRIGHADITVTLGTYAHVMPGDDEAAADEADRVLGRRPRGDKSR